MACTESYSCLLMRCEVSGGHSVWAAVIELDLAGVSSAWHSSCLVRPEPRLKGCPRSGMCCSYSGRQEVESGSKPRDHMQSVCSTMQMFGHSLLNDQSVLCGLAQVQ
jgi:hypothetical protein